jgi:hypothetical protein
MHAAVPAMVKLAKPQQVLRRLNPLPDFVRVAYSRVILLEPLEVDTVLKAELNVAVVQLEGSGAFAEVIAVLTDRTLGGLLGASPVSVEVPIMRIRLARKMLRVVNRV